MTLYEQYAPDASALNKTLEIDASTKFRGQSFTIGTVGDNDTHTLSQVVIKAYRVGNPGTVSVVIKAADANGKPTGAVLAAGSFNANSITTNTVGETITIDMTPEVQLTAGTQYCLYVSADFT